MSLSLDEFRALKPLKVTEQREEFVRGLRMMAQESVRAEALTGDPVWDGFLAFLEAFIAVAKSTLDAELAKLRDPLFANEEEVRKTRAVIVRLDTRIATLEQVIGLPALLKKDAEKAQAILKDLPAAEG